MVTTERINESEVLVDNEKVVIVDSGRQAREFMNLVSGVNAELKMYRVVKLEGSG